MPRAIFSPVRALKPQVAPPVVLLIWTKSPILTSKSRCTQYLKTACCELVVSGPGSWETTRTDLRTPMKAPSLSSRMVRASSLGEPLDTHEHACAAAGIISVRAAATIEMRPLMVGAEFIYERYARTRRSVTDFSVRTALRRSNPLRFLCKQHFLRRSAKQAPNGLGATLLEPRPSSGDRRTSRACGR